MAGERHKLWVVFATVTLDFIGFGLIIPLLIRYAEDFGAGGVALGALFMSYALMQMIFSPIWGKLSDQRGRRPVLLWSIAGNTLALLLAGFAANFWVLLVARALSGIFTANVSVASAYIADVTVATERARGMGLLGAARGIGFVVGPIMGGLLAEFGLDVPFFVAAALSCLNLVVAWLLLPETIHRFARRARFTFSLKERWEIFERTDDFKPLLWLGFVQVLVFAMMEMSFVLFIERRMHLSSLYTAVYSARLFAFIGLIMVVVQGIGLGRLLGWFSESLLIRGGLFLLALSMLNIPFTPSGNWLFFICFAGLIALGHGCLTPTLTGVVSRQGDLDEQGGLLGVYQSVLALGRVIGPMLAGGIFEFYGENGAYWLGGALMVGLFWYTFSRGADLEQFLEFEEEDI